MNELIKDGHDVLKDKSKTDSELSLNTSKEVNIFEYYPELNTLKNEFRDLILNDDSITPE